MYTISLYRKHRASKKQFTNYIKFSLQYNNNDRLTAFDPGQPG